MNSSFLPDQWTPAVVPVFVNAGAALLPAIAAGVVSVVSLLLRPRALLDACRRRPVWAMTTVVALVAAIIATPRLLAVFTAAPAGAAPPPSAVDWPALARDLLQARRDDPAVLSPLWHYDLQGHMGLANVCVFKDTNGRVTVYMPTALLTTEKSIGTLLALDGRTGQRRWQATAGPGGRAIYPSCSAPVVAAGGTRVIAGEGLHDNANCALLCFDTADGRLIWSAPTTQHLESSPALFVQEGEERVAIGAGAIEGPDGKAVGDPGYVYCVSVPTGRELWRYRVIDAEAPPIVDENKIVYAGAGVGGNAVVALRSESEAALAGRPRLVWNAATDYPATGDPILAHDEHLGDLLILGSGNGEYVHSNANPTGVVLALDRATGRKVWEGRLPDTVLGRPAVHEKLVLAGCRDGRAYALNLANGQVVWSAQVSVGAKVPVLSGIVAQGRYAYALAGDGTLAVLALADGRVVERRLLRDPAVGPVYETMSTPAILDGVLYVATDTAGVYAFRIGN